MPEGGTAEPGQAASPAYAARYVRLGDLSGVREASRLLAQRSVTSALTDALKTPTPTVPSALRSEIAAQFIDASWVRSFTANVRLPVIDPAVSDQVIRNLRAGLQTFAASWAKAFEGFKWPDSTTILPANLREIDVSLQQVRVLVHEGVTLYGVPGPLLSRRLLAAPDRAARRAILGRELPRIGCDCATVLDGCVAPDTRETVTFARNAIAAIQDGHIAAGQALASNALESLLRTWFREAEYKKVTSHRETTADDVDDWALSRHLALGPVWAAYQRYQPGGNALIPGTFARHASTHAVSSRQYNKRNAAQALLLLTSLIVYVNEEVAYPQAAAG